MEGLIFGILRYLRRQQNQKQSKMLQSKQECCKTCKKHEKQQKWLLDDFLLFKLQLAFQASLGIILWLRTRLVRLILISTIEYSSCHFYIGSMDKQLVSTTFWRYFCIHIFNFVFYLARSFAMFIFKINEYLIP